MNKAFVGSCYRLSVRVAAVLVCYRSVVARVTTACRVAVAETRVTGGPTVVRLNPFYQRLKFSCIPTD